MQGDRCRRSAGPRGCAGRGRCWPGTPHPRRCARGRPRLPPRTRSSSSDDDQEPGSTAAHEPTSEAPGRRSSQWRTGRQRGRRPSKVMATIHRPVPSSTDGSLLTSTRSSGRPVRPRRQPGRGGIGAHTVRLGASRHCCLTRATRIGVLVGAVAMGYPSGVPMGHCGRSAAGSASPCQGEGRGFESRRPLAGVSNEDCTVEWPRGEATACKAVYTGSNPVSTSGSSTARAIGAVGARFLDTEEVTGSIPVSPTNERPHAVGPFAFPRSDVSRLSGDGGLLRGHALAHGDTAHGRNQHRPGNSAPRDLSDLVPPRDRGARTKCPISPDRRFDATPPSATKGG